MKLGVRIPWLEQLGEAIAAWWTRPTARELQARLLLEAELRRLSRELREHHQAQRELEKFRTIIAGGGIILVHPSSTWMSFLGEQGVELGGVTVRVSAACPRDHIIAIARERRAAWDLSAP